MNRNIFFEKKINILRHFVTSLANGILFEEPISIKLNFKIYKHYGNR